MKCILCNSRKAKRYCPAKGGSICPVCCGEKRGVEIDCPLDCPYFIEGQNYQQEKVSKQRIRKEGIGSFIRRADLYNKNPEFFKKLELAFVELFRTNKRLRNDDLSEALGLVMKTLDTEKRGILFDYRSDNPIANDLADRIIKVVREEKDSVQITYTRISLDYARDVLQEFLNEVEFFMKNDINPQGYLIHILRYHPEVTEARKDRGRLIISP